MKAAILSAYGQPFEIAEVPTPSPGPGEILVKIAGSGACHSDLHLTSGEMPMLPALPWILGHENAGYVERIGSGVTEFEPGDPVAVYGGWGCGTCRFCSQGLEQLCDVMKWGGIGRPGGYADYLLVPSVRHLVAADGLDPVEVAPLTDAGLTPYRAAKMALPFLAPGSTAVVFGVGGLGQFGVQYLHLLSPARVIAVDISPDKLATAKELGADVVIDPTRREVAEQVKELTGGEGAQAVLDFVGADATLAQAAASVGRQGILVLIGLAGGSLPYSFMGLASEARVTTSTWGSRNELEEVLALARQGKLTSHLEKHPLEDINDVFKRLEHGEIPGRAVLMP